LEALYYASAVVTTVGFGDIAPTSKLSKCITIAILVMSVLGLATLTERLVGAAVEQAGEGLAFGKTPDMRTWCRQQRQQKRKMAASAICIFTLFFLTFGCMVKATMGLCWFDAFYFMTIMCSTVGLGDHVPNTAASKLCVSLGMLIGVPLFGYTLSTVVQYLGEERRTSTHAVDKLDENLINSLQDFCTYMRERDVYKETPDRYDKIDKFEFLCWVLTRSRILEVEDLKVIMTNFRKLDKSGDGELDEEDG